MKTTKTTKTNGKTDAALKDNFEMLSRVYDARKAGLSFSQIEQKFGLRDANGMTAYRMIKRAAKMARSK